MTWVEDRGEVPVEVNSSFRLKIIGDCHLFDFNRQFSGSRSGRDGLSVKTLLLLQDTDVTRYDIGDQCPPMSRELYTRDVDS